MQSQRRGSYFLLAGSCCTGSGPAASTLPLRTIYISQPPESLATKALYVAQIHNNRVNNTFTAAPGILPSSSSTVFACHRSVVVLLNLHRHPLAPAHCVLGIIESHPEVKEKTKEKKTTTKRTELWITGPAGARARSGGRCARRLERPREIERGAAGARYTEALG